MAKKPVAKSNATHLKEIAALHAAAEAASAKARAAEAKAASVRAKASQAHAAVDLAHAKAESAGKRVVYDYMKSSAPLKVVDNK